MEIIITSRTTTVTGPNVTMDCPSCKSIGIAGETAAVEERNRLFAVIPFFTSRWVTVQCGSCKRYFGSSRSLDELGRMTRQEFSEMLATWQATNVDFLVKFCIVTSVVLGIIPVFGLIFGVIGVACTYKRRTGWRIAAWVGLVISLLSSLILLAGLILSRYV